MAGRWLGEGWREGAQYKAQAAAGTDRNEKNALVEVIGLMVQRKKIEKFLPARHGPPRRALVILSRAEGLTAFP